MDLLSIQDKVREKIMDVPEVRSSGAFLSRTGASSVARQDVTALARSMTHARMFNDNCMKNPIQQHILDDRLKSRRKKPGYTLSVESPSSSPSGGPSPPRPSPGGTTLKTVTAKGETSPMPPGRSVNFRDPFPEDGDAASPRIGPTTSFGPRALSPSASMAASMASRSRRMSMNMVEGIPSRPESRFDGGPGPATQTSLSRAVSLARAVSYFSAAAGPSRTATLDPKAFEEMGLGPGGATGRTAATAAAEEREGGGTAKRWESLPPSRPAPKTAAPRPKPKLADFDRLSSAMHSLSPAEEELLALKRARLNLFATSLDPSVRPRDIVKEHSVYNTRTSVVGTQRRTGYAAVQGTSYSRRKEQLAHLAAQKAGTVGPDELVGSDIATQRAIITKGRGGRMGGGPGSRAGTAEQGRRAERNVLSSDRDKIVL